MKTLKLLRFKSEFKDRVFHCVGVLSVSRGIRYKTTRNNNESWKSFPIGNFIYIYVSLGKMFSHLFALANDGYKSFRTARRTVQRGENSTTTCSGTRNRNYGSLRRRFYILSTSLVECFHQNSRDSWPSEKGHWIKFNQTCWGNRLMKLRCWLRTTFPLKALTFILWLKVSKCWDTFWMVSHKLDRVKDIFNSVTINLKRCY